jgi:hypothetical protein
MYACGATGKFWGLRTNFFGTHILVLANFQQAPVCGEGNTNVQTSGDLISLHTGPKYPRHFIFKERAISYSVKPLFDGFQFRFIVNSDRTRSPDFVTWPLTLDPSDRSIVHAHLLQWQTTYGLNEIALNMLEPHETYNLITCSSQGSLSSDIWIRLVRIWGKWTRRPPLIHHFGTEPLGSSFSGVGSIGNGWWYVGFRTKLISLMRSLR